MPKRSYEQPDEFDNFLQPKKKCSNSVRNQKINKLKEGEILQDISARKWKLGKEIGIGGFGEIYSASPSNVESQGVDGDSYVAKVESHTSGPLFVEINCYLRIAKPEMIEDWKRKKNLKELGIAPYIASGSHVYNKEKLRFLILPRFQKDLEQILKVKKVFNLKTVLLISYQIMDILEYIHSKGYIHSDIKASNILLNQMTTKLEAPTIRNRLRDRSKIKSVHSVQIRRSQRQRKRKWDESPSLNENSNKDQVHLLDFGLASKYLLSNGEHKQFCKDERKANAGTLLFCSRDAHEGVQSRRSDLEILGYNMIYWLTGYLPWLKNIEEPEIVKKKKQRCFMNPELLLNSCFSNYPKFLLEYFRSIYKLKFDETPDYETYRKLFKRTLTDYGYKNDSDFDFDNIEKPLGGKFSIVNHKKIKQNVTEISRLPLQSNTIPIRPLLRKKIKKNSNEKIKNNNSMHWSKILISNPEVLFREKKSVSENQTILDLDLKSMNPTEAMIEIYNRSKERHDVSPRYRSDNNNSYDNIEGYTPAMIQIYNRMKVRQQLESEQQLYENSLNNQKKNKKVVVGLKRKKKIVKMTELPPTMRGGKSLTVVQNESVQSRNKLKNVPLKRTYSLRG